MNNCSDDPIFWPRNHQNNQVDHCHDVWVLQSATDVFEDVWSTEVVATTIHHARWLRDTSLKTTGKRHLENTPKRKRRNIDKNHQFWGSMLVFGGVTPNFLGTSKSLSLCQDLRFSGRHVLRIVFQPAATGLHSIDLVPQSVDPCL